LSDSDGLSVTEEPPGKPGGLFDFLRTVVRHVNNVD
jgi:hypothetical protein